MEDLTICLTYFKTERGSIHACTVGRKSADIKTNATNSGAFSCHIYIFIKVHSMSLSLVFVIVNEDLPVVVMLLQIRDELLERLH